MEAKIERIKYSARLMMGLSGFMAVLMLIGCFACIAEAVINREFAVQAAKSVGNAADCAFYAVTAFTALRLFRNIVSMGTPFGEKNDRLIKAIGVITLIQGVASPAVRASLLGILHADVTYTSNSTLLFMGMIILFIAKIFSYGQILQQESDETL